jgi:hypothetical protein
MTKRKDRQYNDQKKGQTIQWPKERTDNTMAKRKDKQYNVVLFVLSFGQCIFCPFFWSVYFLSFLLVIVLSVLSFGHCIVCPFFWSLYCLSFKKGQTMQWPNEKGQNDKQWSTKNYTEN